MHSSNFDYEFGLYASQLKSEQTISHSLYFLMHLVTARYFFGSFSRKKSILVFYNKIRRHFFYSSPFWDFVNNSFGGSHSAITKVLIDHHSCTGNGLESILSNNHTDHIFNGAIFVDQK